MPFSPASYIANTDLAGNSVKAEHTVAIATGASTTIVKSGAGRVINALITTAGTGGDNGVVYDNTAGSGTILAVIPGASAVNTQITIDMPASTGITIVNVGSGPAFTLGYS